MTTATSRLDKFLCDLGIATRREAREMIRRGRVAVDGVAVKEPDKHVDVQTARVTLDGEALVWKKNHYFMMNKPAGVLSATEDARQKPFWICCRSSCAAWICFVWADSIVTQPGFFCSPTTENLPIV